MSPIATARHLAVVEQKPPSANREHMKMLIAFVAGVALVALSACRNPVDLQCNGLGLEPVEFSDRQDPPMILQNRYTVPNRPGGINGDCLTLYDSLGFPIAVK